MLRRGLVSLLTTLLLAVPFALAQQPNPAPPQDSPNVDASNFGERIDLSSAWLFSPTDSPAYASPDYDDHAWTRITTSRELASYGFGNFPFCWYRLHVRLPLHARNVVLALGEIFGRYQAFANGVQIAGSRTLPAGTSVGQHGIVDFSIPNEALASQPGELTLALRFATADFAGTIVNPIHSRSSIYLVSADAAPRDASYAATHGVAPSLVIGGLSFLVGLVALALFLAMRDRREYAAAAATLLAISAYLLMASINELRSSTNLGTILVALSIAFVCLGEIEFVRLVFLLPRTRFILIAESAIFLTQATAMPLFLYLPNSVPPYESLYYGSSLGSDVVVFTLLVQGWRRQNPDAIVLFPLFCISFADDFWRALRRVIYVTRHMHLPGLPSLHLASYTLTFNDLDNLVFSFTILLFLVLRTVRIARERTRIASELEAAQSVQQLLLARSSEPTPGFHVESVYLPASEVGGDFFLVSPDPHDGSLTALVGDVSGKGLQAAMRVSMILGMLRREDLREPATILLHLNKALHTQGGVGFTTACCLQLQQDGAFRVANAGHISPYINGAELETVPGLPLGLTTEQEYAESTGRLATGDRIVLMSDGVVEARDKKGALYGFDRLAALTLESAGQIAATAQAFGQEDDITVLTIICAA